jgi:hypothetical protein
MAKLPNAERAVVEIEKLRDYALNPEHDEGKHKARVFRAALGFTQADARRLREMILEAAPCGEAVEGKLTRHGQLYTLDFVVPGLQGDVTIRTGWIVGVGTDFPRLVTCYVA